MTFRQNHTAAATLTPMQVIDIFLRGSGKKGFRPTHRELAAEYNVTTETVGRILRKETWRETTRPYWGEAEATRLDEAIDSYTPPSQEALERVRQMPDFQAMEKRLMKVAEEASIEQQPSPPTIDYGVVEGETPAEMLERLRRK